MSRLTRSMPSRWNRIWLRPPARTTSTGSSTSARIRAQLVEGACRDDDARLRDGVEDRDGLDRDPVVVGGGERQLVALEPRQDAGQDRSRLVAGGREGGLRERPAQDVLGDPGRRPLAGGADGRELVGVDALDVGLEPSALQVEDVARLEREVDPLAARQRVDEVGQELGRDRRRAVGLDLAGHPVGDPDLEVGRRQLEAGVLGLEQDVGEDRQRAPVGHGPTDDRQAARQVLLHDREFHVGFTPPSSIRWFGTTGNRGLSGRRSGPSVGRGYLLSIISPRHHRSNGVETVDGHAPRRTDEAVDDPAVGGGHEPGASVRDGGRAVDGRSPVPAGLAAAKVDSSTNRAHRTHENERGCPQGTAGFPPIWRGYPQMRVVRVAAGPRGSSAIVPGAGQSA